MIKTIFGVLLFAISISHVAFSQNTFFQKVNGIISDDGSGLPIEGVNILIDNGDSEKGTSTDIKGQFEFSEIPVGRYNIIVSHIGYEKIVIRDILVEASKVKSLEISLIPAPYELDEITISEEGYYGVYQKPSTYTFNTEQSQRVAATFYDPARMALSFPGTTSANDQGNNISIRGNTPFGNKWKLQGADIVNPNHLTNAGTPSDRVSIVGGGVSILSAQLMGNTKLLTGAFPSNYGDALGGFMDINLRKGNNSENEYTLQAGLLGLDLAAEGPFNKNSKASFLVNYRYSTLGVLDAMGVEVSPEKINFQDLAFNISIPTKGDSEWGAFGMIGLSSETFDADRDSSLWEINEDRMDTEFSSDMGAFGITNKSKIGNKSSLNTVVAYSKIQAERNTSYVNDDYSATPFEDDTYSQDILAFNSVLNFSPSVKHQFFTGITINNIGYNLLSSATASPETPMKTVQNSDGNYQVFKAFGNWSPIISTKLRADIGLHLLYFNLNNEFSAEPRLGLNYLPSARSAFSFNYGLVSQSQFPQAYFVRDTVTNELPNLNLKLTKSHQFTLSYSYQINPLTTLRVEGYLMKHFNVPVSVDITSSYSILNAVDVLIDQQLTNEGTGENMGAEIMLNRAFKNGYYFVVSSAIYDAKYTALDNIKRNTLFNGNYSSTLTFGKELVKVKNQKNNITGFNVRFIWQGGYRHSPIDRQASEEKGQTVYEEDEAFSLKYDDFIRTDLRIYFKKNKEKYTRTLSFDIQNLTNRQNIAYQYYDPHTNNTETKYQLGLIPFITYRVEF